MHNDSLELRDALAGARIRKLSRSITLADLAAGVANGASVDVPLVPNLSPHALGAGPPRNALPAAAVLWETPKIKLDAQFIGGGATAVGVTVGTAAAPTLLATSFDVRGGAASGLFVDMTRGAQRVVPGGGQLVVARFTPDAGHALAGLTAGACTIELYYFERAAR